MIWFSILMGYGLLHIITAQDTTKDFCKEEDFNVTCPPGHMILMTYAHYGRMKASRCITNGVSNGCSTNVLDDFHKACFGRQTCFKKVVDLIALEPCGKDYTSYLEAAYECIKVTKPSSCDGRTSVSLTGPDGYLMIAGSAPHGRPVSTPHSEPDCPVNIEVSRGQSINITVLYSGAPGESVYQPPCRENLKIADGPNMKERDICHTDGRLKWRQVYTSEANKVTLFLTKQSLYDTLSAKYLLRYKAVGCMDREAPPNGHAVRQGSNTVKVKCNFTEEIWYLTCTDNQWVGDVGNCTTVHSVTAGRPSGETDMSVYIPHGVVFAVLIGIVLGVAIGAMLLLTVHCVKHKRAMAMKSSFVMVPQDIKDKYYEDTTYTTTGTLPPHGGQMKDPYPALIRDSEIYETNASRTLPGMRSATVSSPPHCMTLDGHNVHIKTFPHERTLYPQVQQCKECVCPPKPANNRCSESVIKQQYGDGDH